MASVEHHITVSRTARYHTLGEPSAATREVWFVLHGHAQLSFYFIRGFAGLDDGSRYIVAPEGLNRFYLEQTHWKSAGQARVGATWMTRDDREHEIADYVGYLDALYAEVFTRVPRERVKVVALGFSQGVSTACRWLVRGKARADTLVLWAGPIPPEIDQAAAAPLRAMRLISVIGDADETASAEVREAEARRAEALGLRSERITFAGGHHLDAGVLARIAAP
jgi:poly(3-hydroxybutyrate) depolymerase